MGYEDQTLFRSSSMKRSVKKKEEEKRKAVSPALPSPPPIPSMPYPPSTIHPASRVLSISEPVQYWPSMYPEIIASFMETSYPARKPNSTITLSHYLMSEIVGLPNKGDMVEKAICALACVFMGRHEANHQLLVHGVSLYNSAIRSLAAMLCRNPSHEDIVYTTYIFQEIEVRQFKQDMRLWDMKTNIAEGSLLSPWTREMDYPRYGVECKSQKLSRQAHANHEPHHPENLQSTSKVEYSESLIRCFPPFHPSNLYLLRSSQHPELASTR